LGTLLTCTGKGKVCVRSIAKGDAPSNQSIDSPSQWSVTKGGGQVLCSSLDPSENYALFGGCVFSFLLEAQTLLFFFLTDRIYYPDLMLSDWVSFRAYPNLFGIKGVVVVVDPAYYPVGK
jgi:hypothetical protein